MDGRLKQVKLCVYVCFCFLLLFFFYFTQNIQSEYLLEYPLHIFYVMGTNGENIASFNLKMVDSHTRQITEYCTGVLINVKTLKLMTLHNNHYNSYYKFMAYSYDANKKKHI